MNVYGGSKEPFFQMQFAVAKAIPQLSGNATKLIVFLASKAHRHNAVELELSQSQIADRTKIKDHKTIRKAARELESAGLLRVRPSPAGVFSYVLVDAANGDPLPKPERYSGVLRYRKSESKAGRLGSSACVAAPLPTESESTIARKLPKAKSPIARIIPPSKRPEAAAFCKIHPTASIWHLADDTPRCEGCHRIRCGFHGRS